MNKFLSFFKNISNFLALPLLSGVLVGTSYIPFVGWALLFCYIPLWLKALQLNSDNKSLKQIFMAGWITQFILTLIGFNWIYYVSTEFGHLPWWIAVGALFLFAAFMHLYIPVALVLAIALIRKFKISYPLIQLLLIAISIGLIERIWPSIFEWNLAYTLLWIKFPLYQWADTVGFWGLSTWIFLTQAWVAFALMHFKTDRAQTYNILAHVLVVLIVLTTLGYFKGKTWEKTDRLTRIAVVQGNIGNAEKVLSEKKQQYHSYIRGVYTELTEQHLQKYPTDLVIWPETAMPFALDKNYHNNIEQQTLLKSANKWGIPVITGGYSVNPAEKDHLGDTAIRNAVFYISPNFSFSDHPYFKTNLLAFGEYLPFGETFPYLYKLLPFVGTYAKGSGPVISKLAYKDKFINLGPQICYDSLYPGFTRDLARNGAQVLFNVTNDAWYGWWAEPFQHQYMTLARAVEVRRPLVRSTNTGYSSAILADGTVLTNSPMNETWAQTYDIRFKKEPKQSLYTQFGYLDWVLWLGLAIGLIFIYKQKAEHV